MALSASCDKNGRVSLQTTLTPSVGIVWSKSPDGGATWHAIDTTGAGVKDIADNRPNKNYKFTDASSFSFTGVELAIYGDVHDNLGSTGITIDGQGFATGYDPGDWSRIDGDLNQIIWGTSGLTYASHSVDIAYSSPSEDWYYNNGERNPVYRGCRYSTMSVPFGTPMIYRAVIDGTTTETVTITPAIDRKAARQAIVDRFIAGGGILTAAGNDSPPIYGQTMNGLAGAFFLTGDSRIAAIASAIYDAHVAIANGTTGLMANASLTMDGRNPIGFWFAYNQFGDSRYLAMADKIASTLLNTWPRNASGAWKETYSGSTDNVGGNHVSFPCFGLALLYDEPASVHYQSSAVRTLILDQIQYGITHGNAGAGNQINPVTGAIAYYPGTIPEFHYASMEWPHLRYISERFGWQSSLINLATQWEASQFNNVEPYFYRSEWHWYQDHMHVFNKMLAYFKAYDSFPLELTHAIYSAAFDHEWQNGVASGDFYDSNYQPGGYPASSAPLAWGQFQYSFFESVVYAVKLDAPLSEWFVGIPDGVEAAAGDALSVDGGLAANADVPDAALAAEGEDPEARVDVAVNVPDEALSATGENPVASAEQVVSTPDGVQLVYGDEPIALEVQGDYTIQSGARRFILRDSQGRQLLLKEVR